MSHKKLVLDLHGTKVSPQEKVVLLETLSNWDNLHSKLSVAADRGDLDELALLKMLKVEVTSRKRMLICTRLLAVYHRIVKASFQRQLAVALTK